MMKPNQRAPLSLGGPSHQKRDDSDDQTMMTEFTKQTTASAPPSLSKYHAPPAPSKSSKRHNHGRRRASTSYVPKSKDTGNEFGFPNAFTDDPFAGASSNDWNDSGSKSRRAHTRRSSVDGTTRRETSSSADDPFGGNSSSTKPPKHNSQLKRKNADFGHKSFSSFDDFAPPAPMISSKAAYQTQLSTASEEIALSGLKRNELATTSSSNKPAVKENPLLSIPDPLAEYRREQQQEEAFFAEMSKSRSNTDNVFADPSAFHASARFSDEHASDEEDFSDDGTILWEEGGVIVSRAEKYNRSSGSLNTSGSFLNTSSGNLSRASRRSSTGRKRLDGLEIRNRKGTDDDLTTATPSTRFSTDSEYSAATSRSRKNSTAPAIELKTGSLLNDLVLIMDGKLEIPGGKEEESPPGKEPRPSRRRSTAGHESGTRQPRRKSNDQGTDATDPFVVRQEGRGENMRSFSMVSRTKSHEMEGSSRRSPPGRNNSSSH